MKDVKKTYKESVFKNPKLYWFSFGWFIVIRIINGTIGNIGDDLNDSFSYIVGELIGSFLIMLVIFSLVYFLNKKAKIIFKHKS